MPSRRTYAVAVAFLAACAAGVAGGEALDGRALYLQQCARCHGIDGRGDGVDAALFITPPPSLRGAKLAEQPPSQLVEKILDGRRQQLALDLSAMRQHIADVETTVAFLQRLPDIRWADVDSGQVLFVERCAPCHGVFGRPGPDATLPPGVARPRDLADPEFQRRTSDEEMTIAVRHGRDRMPGLVPRLSEAEAQQAVAFVRILSPGYVTYATYCAGCHGDHGIGVGSFAESYPAPTVIFDRQYFASHDGEKLRVDAWHMLREHRPAMPHFRATLTPAEAGAIVTYLRQLDGEP